MDKEELNINELLEDIRKIKDSIKQNSYPLREKADSTIFKLLLFTGGITGGLIPLLYYIFLKNYGRYLAIPFEIRLFLSVTAIIGTGLVAAEKIIFYFRMFHFTPRPSFSKIFNRLFSRQVMLLYPGLIGTMLLFVIFFIMRQQYYLIVPATAIGLGIIFSMIGSFTSFLEIFFFGNYIWILGVVSIPFIIASPLTSLLWVSAIFGLGMLAFGFYLTFFYQPDKEH